MVYQQFLLFIMDAKEYSLQWKWAGVSMNHTSPPPAPSSRTIYLMGGNGGPGQHRAGECCLTEDNYQLCIITCVAGHRGHRQGWKLGTTQVTKWSWAIWWMSWRIQQVYKCTWRTQICVINPLQTNNDYLCVYHLLPSTINHSPSSFPGLCRSGGRLAGSRGETWPRTLPRLR